MRWTPQLRNTTFRCIGVQREYFPDDDWCAHLSLQSHLQHVALASPQSIDCSPGSSGHSKLLIQATLTCRATVRDFFAHIVSVLEGPLQGCCQPDSNYSFLKNMEEIASCSSSNLRSLYVTGTEACALVSTWTILQELEVNSLEDPLSGAIVAKRCLQDGLFKLLRVTTTGKFCLCPSRK